MNVLRFLYYFCCFCLCFALHFPSDAKTKTESTITLADTATALSVWLEEGYYSEIFVDTKGEYNSNNFLEIPFKERTSYEVFDPQKHAAVWLKLRLKKDAASFASWCLFNVDQNVGELTFYYQEQGQWKSSSGGKSVAFSKRPIPAKHIGMLLNMDRSETKTIYLKFTGDLYFLIWPKIMQIEDVMTFEKREDVLLSVCYGFLLIMAIYNLILFVSIRQKKYLFFVFYVLATALFLTIGDSFLFEFIWPNLPGLNSLVFYWVRPVLILFFLLYSIAFLNPSKKVKRLIWSAFLVFGFVFLHDRFTVNSHHYYLLPLFYLFMSVVGFMKSREGFYPARVYALATLLVTLGMTNTALLSKGVFVSQSFYQFYLIYFCIAVEVVLYSFSLAQELNFFRSQKISFQNQLIGQLKTNEELQKKVNRELEAKVKARTEELETKNQHLEDMHQELNRLNAALDKSLWQKNKEIAKVTEHQITKGIKTYEAFKVAFPNDFSCLQYISKLKWGDGFVCKKCGHEKWSKGDQPLSRKCTKCNSRESVTSTTVFHRLRFPIQKAMYLTYYVLEGEKQPLSEVSAVLGLNVSTCSLFKKKIKEELAKYKSTPLFDTFILKKY